MKMTNKSRLLSIFLCMVLIAAMALITTACDNVNLKFWETTTESTVGDPETPGVKKTFTFIVVDKEGAETSFTVSTDKKTVGEALLAEGLIEGEDGAYGLYVKKVNGITADYDINQTYWAFYINGEYAMSGVDQTNVQDGAIYAFKVEK